MFLRYGLNLYSFLTLKPADSVQGKQQPDFSSDFSSTDFLTASSIVDFSPSDFSSTDFATDSSMVDFSSADFSSLDFN